MGRQPDRMLAWNKQLQSYRMLVQEVIAFETSTLLPGGQLNTVFRSCISLALSAKKYCEQNQNAAKIKISRGTRTDNQYGQDDSENRLQIKKQRCHRRRQRLKSEQPNQIGTSRCKQR